MVLGVDYMGRWASIHLNLAIEPETLPLPPLPSQRPRDPENAPPILAIIVLIASVLLLLIGLAGQQGELAAAGGIGCFVSLIIYMTTRSQAAEKQREAQLAWEQEQQRRQHEWEEAQRKHALRKEVERMVRTFKIDDMRLFRTAMKEVFKLVVADIVQLGGEVVQRIEGSHGLLGDDHVGPAAPRVSDAANAGV
jgi:hypothetical protein